MEPWPLLLLLSPVLAYVVAEEYSPIINTKSGPVRGRLIRAKDPRADVYAFTGIPFAEPPTGQRRYRKPVPVKSWNNAGIPLDATRVPNSCLQSDGMKISDFFSAPVLGSEDCLYLNIWVPKCMLDPIVNNTRGTGDVKLLSTFIFIHGGAFLGGSASIHNGTLLAGFNNIVVAAIQYRLGSLGFAYYKPGTEELPGNMGLWDQLEALKWLYENVGFFGGNNSEITIGGQSAGAASVTFHLLSPYSRPYFQRAIVQSGVAISPWAAHTKEQASRATDIMFEQVAQRFCNQTGTVSVKSPVSDKIRCLKAADGSAFPRSDVAATLGGFGIPFTPVIDGDFLPRDPYEMLRAGDYSKVPLLIGATKDEGSSFLAMSPEAFMMLPTPAFPEKPIDNRLNFTHYRSIISSTFQLYLSGLQPINSVLMNAVELQYWPQTHIGYPKGPEIVDALSAMVGDNSLICPTFAWAQEAANFASVYTYYFTHRRVGENVPEWMGVMHSAEMPFLFGNAFEDDSKIQRFTREDGELSLVVMSYWTNFVKYGDPNGIDGALAAKNHIVLRKWPNLIGNDCNSEEAVLCDLKARDCMFWQEFYPQLLSALGKKGQEQASMT